MAGRNIPDLDLLTEQWEPKVRKAFLDSIDGITDRAKIAELARLIERGDIEGVLDYLRINRLAYQRLELAIRDAYEAGGFRFASNLPGFVSVIFDLRNPQAEQWLRDKSSTLVTGIVEDQRSAIRGYLVEGLQQGQNPRTSALELVGRVARATGKRQGGIIGLTAQQEASQRAYALELSSDDPALLRAALRRQLRDKRFDRSITKAIRGKRALPAEIRVKMLTAYRNRMLKYRADVIARTETLQSIAGSQYETYRQAIAAGELRADQVTKIWKSGLDERVRFSHNVLHNQTAAFDAAFVSPLGNRLRFPGDRELGADARDTIQCRCRLEYNVRFE
ncbi:hypothetical protein KUV46_15700 [Thalassovita mediterranea]|nr:hypothetical protein KUV46_15700 [Thalassovita mediterranea]